MANPVRCIAANRKSPERSPVNIRPVRLAPCAAGARPTTSTEAAGSPKPGTGRAQYVSSRNAARFSTPTSSRHATSRGHARHVGTTASSAARSGAAAAARATSSGAVGSPVTEQPVQQASAASAVATRWGSSAGVRPSAVGHPPAPIAITGTPVRTASATSLRVPHDPPTLTTTSLDRTSSALRSSPRPGRDRDRDVRVGVGPVGPGQQADDDPAGRRGPARDRRHDPAEPAADDDVPALGEPAAERLGVGELVGAASDGPTTPTYAMSASSSSSSSSSRRARRDHRARRLVSRSGPGRLRPPGRPPGRRPSSRPPSSAPCRSRRRRPPRRAPGPAPP